MNGQINEKQSLVGNTMPSNGKSAYEYAKDGGYNGTEQEFAEKLATEYVAKSLTSQAFYEDSNAFGTDNIVGYKGYYVSAIDLTNKKIYLTNNPIHPLIGVHDLTDDTFETPAYAVGDYFNIINDEKYVQCGSIVSIANNVVTYDGFLGFSEVADDTIKFYVPAKAGVGSAVFGGNTSLATGYNNMVAGSRAFASGMKNVVVDNFGTIFGSDNVAGYVCFVQGSRNKALGQYAIAMGGWNEALGEFTRCFGYQGVANGSMATTFGIRTKANSTGAFVTGLENTVNGEHSRAGGYNCQANSIYGVSEGAHNIVHSGGIGARANGVANEVKGYGGSADGYKNISNGFAQSVRGMLNIEDTEEKYLDIVGNGNSATNERRNAYTLDRNGNGWFSGGVKGTHVEAEHILLKSPSGKTYKVTVDDSGALKTTLYSSGWGDIW
jgi:hypothetical protein